MREPQAALCLGAAPKTRARARGLSSPGSLSDAARKGLLKGTVVEDTLAESAYSALHKAAGNRKQPPRVLISGPTGSGKWHACRQFAQWRKCQDPVIWTDPAHCPELSEGTTLLIRQLDARPESAWQTLAQLADERRDLAIAATFRIDRRQADALVGLLPVQDSLRLHWGRAQTWWRWPNPWPASSASSTASSPSGCSMIFSPTSTHAVCTSSSHCWPPPTPTVQARTPSARPI
ncbi:MAG: ATP-binding protein [Ignavibacteriales bacterium]|nr:ATP-binding protein [Ignavibacteriales bacterium]